MNFNQCSLNLDSLFDKYFFKSNYFQGYESLSLDDVCDETYLKCDDTFEAVLAENLDLRNWFTLNLIYYMNEWMNVCIVNG